MATMPDDERRRACRRASGAGVDVDAGLAGDELARLEERGAGGDRRRHQEAKRAAASRSRPSEAGRPRCEMPDRLMPGTSASAWATPMPSASGT